MALLHDLIQPYFIGNHFLEVWLPNCPTIKVVNFSNFHNLMTGVKIKYELCFWPVRSWWRLYFQQSLYTKRIKQNQKKKGSQEKITGTLYIDILRDKEKVDFYSRKNRFKILRCSILDSWWSTLLPMITMFKKKLLILLYWVPMNFIHPLLWSQRIRINYFFWFIESRWLQRGENIPKIYSLW